MKIKYLGKEITLEGKTSALELAKSLNLTEPKQALAVKIGEEIFDLSQELTEGDTVEFLSFDSPKGQELFWHTSSHVLALAILRLHPSAVPTIGPAIDKGFYYDFANLKISEEDFGKIEEEVKKIIKDNASVQKKIFKNKKEALKAFAHNPYKKELIEDLPEGTFTAYQIEEFLDLCRGPHLPNVGKIKAFKILKTSGAYWRGDATKEMLTRIYAISYPEKELLSQYLHLLEEAKKRDHKILGQQLSLFGLKEEAPGMPFIYPKGLIVWDNLLQFLRKGLRKAGYVEIKTPILLTKELWERSGHWYFYKENMYTTIVEDREFAIKPMNCPGCMLYYKTNSHSYRELPLRIAEFGNVHRYEASGALNGLFRVRSFHQDDAHVFTEKTKITEEILNILTFAQNLYNTFGLSFRMELSTRPEKTKTIGSDQDWENATLALKAALDKMGHPYQMNEGGGAFYGPKIDIHIQDALERSWQCGTVQVDFSLPEKFDLEYIAQDGSRQRPAMIHRALFGSIERFFGVLIEHFAGKFPLWLSPLGVRLIPVADRHAKYARQLADKIEEMTEIVCDVDDSNESVSKKIRNAQLLKINYMITVGDQEVQNLTLSLRTRDNVIHSDLELCYFIEKIMTEKREKSLVSAFAIV
jgi:threonyl-tRNA synthetase